MKITLSIEENTFFIGDFYTLKEAYAIGHTLLGDDCKIAPLNSIEDKHNVFTIDTSIKKIQLYANFQLINYSKLGKIIDNLRIMQEYEYDKEINFTVEDFTFDYLYSKEISETLAKNKETLETITKHLNK